MSSGTNPKQQHINTMHISAMKGKNKPQMITLSTNNGTQKQQVTMHHLTEDEQLIILKVDEEDVKKLSFNDAAAKIRGKEGTIVKLSIKRYGEYDPIQFNLTRSNITVKDVTYAGMISPYRLIESFTIVPSYPRIFAAASLNDNFLTSSSSTFKMISCSSSVKWCIVTCCF
jgi:hypothetical protein